MSTTYKVRARRWTRGWELHIDGVGVTQSHSLADAEAMVRDYISVDLEVPADSFDVQITPEVGDGLDEAVIETRREISEPEQAQFRAAEHSRQIVRSLRAKGLSGKDTAVILGVSPQRVSQLTGKKPGKKRGATPDVREPSQ